MKKIFELVISGLPPTINHLYSTGWHNRRYKTAKAKRYVEEVTAFMAASWHGRPAYKGEVILFLEFHHKTRRHWDIDNRLKAVQDCLEIAGIIDNDTQINALLAFRLKHNRDVTRIVLYAPEKEGQKEKC